MKTRKPGKSGLAGKIGAENIYYGRVRNVLRVLGSQNVRIALGRF